MPSSSARTMTYPRKNDKLHFYNELKELRDELKNAKSGFNHSRTLEEHISTHNVKDE